MLQAHDGIASRHVSGSDASLPGGVDHSDTRSLEDLVAGRLGDDPKTILATYAHLLPHSDAMAAEAVAAAIVDGAVTSEPVADAEHAL